MKTSEQIAARIYANILVVMIALLIGSGIASFFKVDVRNIELSSLLIRFYLLAIPAALIAFTIVMSVRRTVNLAIAGAILCTLWLVFRWVG